MLCQRVAGGLRLIRLGTQSALTFPKRLLLPTELRKLFLDLLKRLLSLFGASHLLGAADQYLHDVLLLRGQGCIQCGVIPLPVQ